MDLRTERQRLFFALWPDASLRHTLYKVTRPAIRASGGKPVPAENFHITLAFLGQLDAEAASRAEAAAAAASGERFELILDRIGFWPDTHVVWFGPSKIPAAGTGFAAALRRELRARGIEVDIRPFMPHLSLARKLAKPGDFGAPRVVHWPVREFVLVHSITGRRASEYHVIAAWPLRATTAEL